MQAKSILLASLFLNFTLAFAQSKPKILTVDKFQKGIYKNFEEFLNDSPSINLDFELNARSKSKQFWLGGSDFDLNIKDTVISNKIKKTFWGVSTGDTIFVNVRNFQENNKGFLRIIDVDRYCLMRGTTSLNQRAPGAAVVGGAILGALASIPKDAVYILNINNGEFFLVNKELIVKIFADDSELLESYSNEKKPEAPEIMISFIKEYNSRHGDQVKLH